MRCEDVTLGECARVGLSELGKDEIYPGEMATPAEIVALAYQYWRAAEVTVQLFTKGQPCSSSPFRLLSIHSIELYLNALLRASGEPAATVRGMQHNLARRLELIDKYGLVLRKRTRAHLAAISDSREYLSSRYAAEAEQRSQMNRLQATLNEVREKVHQRLAA